MQEENNKIIEAGEIRYQYDEKTSKWYFSIIDIVGIATESTDARNYWKVLKNRLKKTQNKLVSECNQLKMISNDGKFYLTDVATQETALELVKLISPHHLPSFHDWFNKIDKKNVTDPYIKRITKIFINPEKNSYPQASSEVNKIEEPKEEAEEEFPLLIDAYCENNIITLKTFIAGLNPEKLIISTRCNSLTIEGERVHSFKDSSFNNKNNDSENIQQELYWGKFSRSISLPYEVEINLGEATEYHGLIIIKIPVINKDRLKVLKLKTI